MSLESALYEHLTADTDVTDVVGTRVFNTQASQGATLPYLVFQIISTLPVHHATAASGIVGEMVQITAFTADRVQQRAARLAVRESLDGRGHFAMGATTALDVRSIKMQPSGGNVIPPTDGTGGGTFGFVMEFDIWHAQSVPTFA